jgi:hypothetical protein
VDDPREIESWHDGLVCLDAVRSVEMPGVDELPALGRMQMRVLAHLPSFRDVGWMLRYQF